MAVPHSRRRWLVLHSSHGRPRWRVIGGGPGGEKAASELLWPEPLRGATTVVREKEDVHA